MMVMAPAHMDLRPYCNPEEWPRKWMCVPEDMAPGKKIVSHFRPFLEQLVRLELSAKTIRKHVDNLWTLGGEIIRDMNRSAAERQAPVEDLVWDAIKYDDGPLLYHSHSEQEQESFDSTCRKFRRFLEQRPRRPTLAARQTGNVPKRSATLTRLGRERFAHATQKPVMTGKASLKRTEGPGRGPSR
jgi:hypothetical protein